jgi:putative endonuclease
MPYAYILECIDGSYYTGSTTDLERRLWQHQQGIGANHTAKRLPVKLVYCEYYDHLTDAFYREKQIQGWCRKKKEALIAGDTNLLHELAECQNETHWLASAMTSKRSRTTLNQPKSSE